MRTEWQTATGLSTAARCETSDLFICTRTRDRTPFTAYDLSTERCEIQLQKLAQRWYDLSIEQFANSSEHSGTKICSKIFLRESSFVYFTYLKNNIFARPTINNDLLPGSKYAQIQAQQNQHTKRAGRSGFAIATDGLEVLQKFVEESYCAKYFKSGKGRKINESVETNAQMLDKTSIRLRDAAQKATRKANQATTIKQGANVDTFSEIITIAATNGNLNPKGGGRNFDRVGEGGNRSDGVNFQISCRSKEIAEKLIGEEAIKEMGKGNNTIEFDTLDKSPLYKKRRMERKRPRPKSAQSVEKIAKKSSRRNALSDSDGDCKRALDYQVENVDCNDI